MRRRSILLAAVAVVVVAIVVAAATAVVFSRHRDSARAASPDAAVRSFRAAPPPPGPAAPVGVFTYATTGSESVSALGGTEHRYPAQSTITVTATGCGLDLRWDVLQHRTSSWNVCRGPEGQQLSGWGELHQFFGQDNRTDWRCDATVWSAPPDAAGRSLPYSCSSSNKTAHGTTTVLGTERVPVAGAAVPTVHLRDVFTEGGAASGTVTEERWVDPGNGLPVRLTSSVRTSNRSPIGAVAFRETMDLRLISLVPRR